MNALISLDKRAGVDISSQTNARDVLDHAGMNFSTELVHPHTPEGDEITNKWIVRRTDSKQVLGFVGARYNTIDNDVMFNPFHKLVAKYGAQYESAGVIGSGKKCWISATLPDSFNLKNRPDDTMQKRIMALICHDGTRRNSYFSVAYRLFCNNQLNLIFRDAGNSDYSVKHNNNWESQWAGAHQGFTAAIETHQKFEQIANMLDDVTMTEEEMRGFVTQVIPENMYHIKDKKDKDRVARYHEKLNARREQVVNLFSNGAGNIGKTRWDALNAVTEFFDHHTNTSESKDKSVREMRAQQRMSSNIFSGAGVTSKSKAIELLQSVRRFKKVKAA